MAPLKSTDSTLNDSGGGVGLVDTREGPDKIVREIAHVAVDSRRSCDLREQPARRWNHAQLPLRDPQDAA